MKFKISDYLSNLDNQVFGKQILYIPSTKSTNDEIWNHFINNDHLIVVTDNQTAGRGQRGNAWVSKKYKSLTFSIGLLDDKRNSSLLSLKCALAVSNAIIKSTGILASTKWPNDVLINNKTFLFSVNIKNLKFFNWSLTSTYAMFELVKHCLYNTRPL